MSKLTKLDYDRVATILVEALYYGDTRTARRWKIHKRTIQNYRARLKDNSDLVLLFDYKRQLFEGKWASDIPATIRMAMRYIQEATNEMVITPEGLHAVTGAFKILAEIGMTREIIDAKLEQLGYNREEREGVGQMAFSQIPANTENE